MPRLVFRKLQNQILGALLSTVVVFFKPPFLKPLIDPSRAPLAADAGGGALEEGGGGGGGADAGGGGGGGDGPLEGGGGGGGAVGEGAARGAGAGVVEGGVVGEILSDFSSSPFSFCF